jgi:hypothetical protein
MRIADFFTSFMASPPTLAEDASAEVLTSNSSHHAVRSSKPSKVETAKTVSSTTTAVAAPPPSSSMMTVNIRAEKPDIILIENMEDLDTNAVILNVCVWI